MRHLKRGRKLNRHPSHKAAMLRNMIASLFVHGRIRTNPAKAKEAQPLAEKVITLAKKGTLHHRRQAISILHDVRLVTSIFESLGPRYKDRPGGYTRILHLAERRLGDRAPQCIFELVGDNDQGAGLQTKAQMEAAAAETTSEE
jgi:large subunit ribosomal protein L17